LVDNNPVLRQLWLSGNPLVCTDKGTIMMEPRFRRSVPRALRERRR